MMIGFVPGPGFILGVKVSRTRDAIGRHLSSDKSVSSRASVAGRQQDRGLSMDAAAQFDDNR